jgi:hypothetical protein
MIVPERTFMIDYNDGASIVAFLFLGFFWLIFALAFYVIGSIFLMKIFEKAGVQGKWRAWVPIYNTLIFVKLGDLNPWWLLVLWGGAIVLGWLPVIGWLIGVAAFVYTLLAAWRVGLKLQKEAVWLILYFFLALVWLGINAFDRSRWNTAIPAAPWAGNFLADTTTWSGIPSQVPAGGYPANPAMVPGGYAPPAGYQPPPAGYQPPPAGYQPPPAGYQAPPAAPAAPSAAPPAYTPPPAAPGGEPTSAQPPVTPPPTGEPPAAPPASPEPPAPEAPEAPKP